MTPTATPTRGPQFTSRPRDDDRPTRKPLALWDRVKYLVLLAALFWFFVWAAIADNALLPFNDAVNDTVSEKRWIFLLGALELIRQIHERNYFAYGSWRMWKALLRAGEQVGRGRVERLMRSNGIQGAKRRGKPWRTTYPSATAYRPADLVERDFSASRPDELWCVDFTSLRCCGRGDDGQRRRR